MKKRIQHQSVILHKGITLLCFLVLCSITCIGQAWQPLNNQPDKTPILSCSDSNFYYVCISLGKTPKGSAFKIMKWDGLLWQSSPTLHLDSFARLTSMTTYKRDLYLGGVFTSIFTNNINNIVCFNNNRWSAVKGGAHFSGKYAIVNSMLNTANGLIVGGDFDSINKVQFNNLAIYNGLSWDKIGRDSAGTNGTVHDLKLLNKKLYASGNFTKIGNVTSSGVSCMENGKWQEIGNLDLIKGLLISSLNGEEMAVIHKSSAYSFKTRKSGIWQEASDGLLKTQYVNDIINFKGILYACGKFYISKEDSAYIIRWDGSKWNKALTGINQCKGFDVFQNKLHVFGKLNFFNSVNHKLFTAKYEPNKVIIGGKIYWDKNNNCIQDSQLETALKQSIRITPRVEISINNFGIYHAVLDKNVTYELEIIPTRNWKPSNCGKLKHNINYQVDKKLRFDFPLIKEDNIRDIQVKISSGNGWLAPKGDRAFYKIKFKNTGSIKQDGTIELNFDERLRDFEAYPAPNVFNPGNVKWGFASLEANEVREISFYVKIDENKIVEEEDLEFVVQGQISNDNYSEDNFDSLQQSVTSQGMARIFKSINPSPLYPDSIAQLTEGSEFVKFLIHFENESVTPVRTVHIIDTIDLSLSLTHIQELAASHPYSTTVKNDPLNPNKGIIIWTFEDINLEKFDVNGGFENPTYGFIAFEMKLKDQMPIGTIISNRAKIIYDYDNEYLTNTVYAEIVDNATGIKDISFEYDKLKVYPNPTYGALKIDLNVPFSKYQVLDATGKIVIENNQMAFNKKQILDLSKLPNGSYLIVAYTDKEAFTRRIIKK